MYDKGRNIFLVSNVLRNNLHRIIVSCLDIDLNERLLIELRFKHERSLNPGLRHEVKNELSRCCNYV